jgi:hypothetical protein
MNGPFYLIQIIAPAPFLVNTWFAPSCETKERTKKEEVKQNTGLLWWAFSFVCSLCCAQAGPDL